MDRDKGQFALEVKGGYLGRSQTPVVLVPEGGELPKGIEEGKWARVWVDEGEYPEDGRIVFRRAWFSWHRGSVMDSTGVRFRLMRGCGCQDCMRGGSRGGGMGGMRHGR